MRLWLSVLLLTTGCGGAGVTAEHAAPAGRMPGNRASNVVREPRNRFGRVEVRGFDAPYLNALEGQWYSGARLNARLDALTNALDEAGHPFAEINESMRQDAERSLISWTIDVEPGPPAFVRRVVLVDEVLGVRRNDDAAAETGLKRGVRFARSKMLDTLANLARAHRDRSVSFECKYRKASVESGGRKLQRLQRGQGIEVDVYFRLSQPATKSCAAERPLPRCSAYGEPTIIVEDPTPARCG